MQCSLQSLISVEIARKSLRKFSQLLNCIDKSSRKLTSLEFYPLIWVPAIMLDIFCFLFFFNSKNRSKSRPLYRDSHHGENQSATKKKISKSLSLNEIGKATVQPNSGGQTDLSLSSCLKDCSMVQTSGKYKSL